MNFFADRFTLNSSRDNEKVRQPSWDETFTPELPDDEQHGEKNPALDIDEPQRREYLTQRPFQYLEF